MRCPVCRAADNRGPQCRRCKADLSLLVHLEEVRGLLLAAATHDAARGDGDACWRHAWRAHELHRDAESQRLLALAGVLRRDFAQAWANYREARQLV